MNAAEAFIFSCWAVKSKHCWSTQVLLAMITDVDKQIAIAARAGKTEVVISGKRVLRSHGEVWTDFERRGYKVTPHGKAKANTKLDWSG